MILNHITLHNFGVYAGRQSIELSPPSPNKPVVLFGGLNGGGKTTFLDAIQLCLFGPFAKCSNRGSLGYEEYLLRCINKNATEAEAALELSFSHREDGTQNEYTVHRSWKKKANGIKENFEVIKNGAFDFALTENWNSQVEDFIPLNISSLFLFDGEKIESYANGEASSSLIHTAIQSLLGLDIVEQLQKDLSIFERKKRSEIVDDDANKKIEEEEKNIQDLHRRVLEVKQEIASINTHQISQLKKKISSAEKEFIKKGGDLYIQRENVHKKYKETLQQSEAIEEEIRLAAEGALPLLLLDKLIDKLKKRDEEESQARISSEILKTLQDRDRELVKILKKQKIGAKALKDIQKYFDEDVHTRKGMSKKPIVVNFSSESRIKLQGLTKQLAAEKDYSNNLINRFVSVKRHLSKNETEFLSIPTDEEISSIEEKRNKLQREMETFEKRLSFLNEELDKLTSDIEKRKQFLGRMAEKSVLKKVSSHDAERFIKFSSKARNTLDAFKQEVISSHIRAIEQLILESYQQLIRKTSFVTDLKIDPRTFNINLYAKNGAVISAERLSAGERQLLAISILWGLAKASGRPLPTAIDTPLGRLDSAHRENIIKRYFPFASHQVLLFSTDQEIVGGYLDGIKSWIGRSYFLDFQEKNQATQIKEGYF